MKNITPNINLNITDTGNKNTGNKNTDNKNTYQYRYENIKSYFSLNNLKILERKIENNFTLNNTEENLNSLNWYPINYDLFYLTHIEKYPFIHNEIYYFPLPNIESEKENAIISLLKNEDPICDLIHLKILLTGLLKEINSNLISDLVKILLIWVKSELLLPVTGNKLTMREFTNITTFIIKSFMLEAYTLYFWKIIYTNILYIIAERLIT